MTRPDLDAIAALLDKNPHDGADAATALIALPALLAYVRELEREPRYPASVVEAAIEAARRNTALAMRERAAQACAALKVNRPSDPLANAFDGACETCTAAVRALEP